MRNYYYCFFFFVRQAVAQREGVLFMETSALSGDHVADAFESVVEQCYYQIKKTKFEAEGGAAGGSASGAVSAGLALEGRKLNVGQESVAGEAAVGTKSNCCG